MSIESPWSRVQKTKSQRQEQRLGKREDGKEQINSGRSTWTSPRDNIIGRIYRFLVEARTTDRGSYRVEKDEFNAITKQAVRIDLLPMVQVDIQDLQLAVVRLRDIDALQAELVDALGRLRELEKQIAAAQEDR